MQMSRHWMYNADRRSQEFIEGVHSFLRVAEANKRDGFMCCPYAICKNLKEYTSSRSLHSHLLKSGFMPNYICWMKHGETGVCRRNMVGSLPRGMPKVVDYRQTDAQANKLAGPRVVF